MDLINRDRFYNELLNRVWQGQAKGYLRNTRSIYYIVPSVPSRLCALYPIILGPAATVWCLHHCIPEQQRLLLLLLSLLCHAIHPPNHANANQPPLTLNLPDRLCRIFSH